MPTNQEAVLNRPLTGTELRAIIERDLAAVLDRDGFLRSQIAYSRVSYEVTVKLHVEPLTEPVTIRVASRLAPKDVPAEAAVEAFPLAGADPDTEIAVGAERHRTVVSPNAARVEHALPITVQRRSQSGELRDEQVKYPADAAPPDPTLVTDTDLTEQVRREVGAGRKRKGANNG